MESERWKLTLLQNPGSAFTLEMVALVLLSQCWSNFVPCGEKRAAVGRAVTQMESDLYLVFEEHV